MSAITMICPGDPLRTTLDELQRQIAALQAERVGALGAYLSADELRAFAEQTITVSMQRRSIAGRLGFVRRGSPGPTRVLFGENARENSELLLALLARVLGIEPMADALVKLATDLPEYVPGAPRDEREARAREIDAELVKLFEQEETECARIEREHLAAIVERRPDADARLILEVWNRVESGRTLRRPGRITA
jgi:hypothetical protein